MTPFDLAPLTPADAPGAHALWTRSVPHDLISLAHFQDAVWGEPAGTALVARQRGAIVGLGVGVRWPVPSVVRGSLRLLAVAPDARRQGIATALTDRLADDLAERGATVLRLAEAAPTYLTPGIDARYASGLAFARARGFADLGEAVNLGVDLAARDWRTASEEARLAGLGVAVRRAAADDGPRLGALLDAEWPAWHPEVEIALARGTLHLAVRDGEALGFAAHSATNSEQGWFGPMGTAPATRGLGIGAVLLHRCLADLRDAGHARATIAWAAALPFYERAAGAAVERRFRRFERAL